MKISFTPIDMLSAPNDFTTATQWNLQQGTAETLWLRLTISDQLGERRYIPASGATASLKFMRIRSSVVGQLDAVQTFSVSATANSDDRSLWSCPLTAAQVALVTSGTVQMVLTIGTTVYTVNKAYAVKKTLTNAGC